MNAKAIDSEKLTIESLQRAKRILSEQPIPNDVQFPFPQRESREEKIERIRLKNAKTILELFGVC